MSTFTTTTSERGSPMRTQSRATAFGRLAACFSRFQHNERGTAFVEFAFIAPIMLLMMYGTVELSQVITADRRVTKTASSVGDLIARGNTFTCTGLNNIMEIGGTLLWPYDTTKLSITVFDVKASSTNGNSHSIKWKAWNGKDVEAPSPLANGGLPTGILTEKDGEVIVVVVNYKYPTPVSGWLFDPSATNDVNFKMSETFYLKPRLGVVRLTNSAGTSDITAC